MKNENDLIRATVLVIFEFVTGLRGSRPVRGHVLIEQHRNAAGVEVAATRDVRRFQMMMAQRTVRHFFRLPLFDQLNFAHPRGWAQVVHDRVGFVESLRGKDMLVGDAFVLVSWRRAVAMKPDVMFSRNLTKFLIIRHMIPPYKLPRASCSRSIASNSALKLPLPKLFAPFRWMIS